MAILDPDLQLIGDEMLDRHLTGIMTIYVVYIPLYIEVLITVMPAYQLHPVNDQYHLIIVAAAIRHCNEHKKSMQASSSGEVTEKNSTSPSS